MKYFILVIVIFFQFLNLSYGSHPSAFCNPSFLKSATPHDLTDALANMRYNSKRKQGWIQEIVFDNRDSVTEVAFLQTCNELGDTPLHVAARVGARFDTMNMLVQEVKKRYPGPLSHILLRKNAEGQTPFEILRNKVAQDLPSVVVSDLDALLELYIIQDIAQEDVLLR